MYLMARKRVRNNEDAKDLVQQTMYKIFRILHKGDLKFTTEESISPYCVSSIKNTFANQVKYQQRHPIFFDDNMDFHPNTLRTDSLAIHSNLNSRLATIKDKYRVPFELSNDGYSGDEIAKKLKIPVGTARNRIFRYKKKQ